MGYKEFLLDESLETIRDFFTSVGGQMAVAEFYERLKPLQEKDAWIELCEKLEGFRVTPEIISQVDEVFHRFDLGASPGHDIGHFQRDQLYAFALKKTFSEASTYPQEIEAGFIAATRHDTASCAVYPRYAKMPLGHPEVGGFTAYHLLDGIIPEPARLLVADAISKHQHTEGEKEWDEPISYKWEALDDSMFEGKDGTLVRTSAWYVRACDRLDLSGPAHGPRHILANADVVEEGYVGQDIGAQGAEVFDIDLPALKKALEPIARESKWNSPPTVVEHIREFGSSQDGSTKFSKNDHLFPKLEEMMAKNVKIGRLFMDAVLNPKRTFMDEYTEARLSVSFAGWMRVVSGSPHFERVWPIVWQAVQEQPEDTKRTWFSAVYSGELLYADWVNYAADQALQNSESEFAEIIKDLRLAALS